MRAYERPEYISQVGTYLQDFNNGIIESNNYIQNEAIINFHTVHGEMFCKKGLINPKKTYAEALIGSKSDHHNKLTDDQRCIRRCIGLVRNGAGV